MKFHKIVALDTCGLVGPDREAIFALSTEPASEAVDVPAGNAEIIRRIGGADCVLVSWRTRIDRDVLSACPGIRYVGMCCTLYDEKAANVDIVAAREKGIVVTGVRDYGDEGTVEFIFAELISLYKGLGARRWSEKPTELGSKTLGIVGMGTLGKMVARAALAFGMKVVYFSRTRKPEVEALGAEYLELGDMLAASDAVSLHLPRSASLLGAGEFGRMRDGAVLVNTSLGRPFDAAAFSAWIRRNENNYAVFDQPGAEAVLAAGDDHPNIAVYGASSGFTAEAMGRLTAKVLRNMREFLAAGRER